MNVNVTQGVAASVESYSYRKTGSVNAEAVSITEQPGAVYEKSASTSNAGYSINRMTEEERAALVDQLKSEEQSRRQQLEGIVQKMFTEQASAYGKANSIWEFIASGNFTVDAETKAQAQQDISENGYYGIKQTSERLFSFASALAGDDVDKMKEMQSAMEKGFKLAAKAWGKELPEISQKTLDAANQLFEDYYASKETEQ